MMVAESGSHLSQRKLTLPNEMKGTSYIILHLVVELISSRDGVLGGGFVGGVDATIDAMFLVGVEVELQPDKCSEALTDNTFQF